MYGFLIVFVKLMGDESCALGRVEENRKRSWKWDGAVL